MRQINNGCVRFTRSLLLKVTVLFISSLFFASMPRIVVCVFNNDFVHGRTRGWTKGVAKWLVQPTRAWLDQCVLQGIGLAPLGGPHVAGFRSARVETLTLQHHLDHDCSLRLSFVFLCSPIDCCAKITSSPHNREKFRCSCRLH